ncbi:MAG: RNA polymerase sigma factor [Planctomycetes bacterium]|nr:RNA polymerase sigma factor [Planctomycetota bacterium]
MSSPSSASSSAALLAELSWLRALARALVRDAHRADDLAQEAAVLALERAPSSVADLRAWLARVLRNLVARERRAEARRARRERQAARPEQDGNAEADALVLRVERERELARAVLALKEPFRGTLLLRYHEGLSPRRIAAREGVPVETVKSRLKRALAQLRAELDRGFGDRRAWMIALAPLLAPARPSAAATTAIAAGLVAAAAYGVLALRESEESAARGFVLEKSTEAAPDGERRPSALRIERHRIASAEESTTPGSIPLARFDARARALDLEGQPVADLRIAFVSADRADAETAELLTDAEGRVRLDVLAPRGRFALSAEVMDHAALYEASFDNTQAIEPLLIVAPRGVVAGAIVDAEGRAVEDALVELRWSESRTARIREPLAASSRVRYRQRSDARGAFHFDSAPLAPGLELVATTAAGVIARQELAPTRAEERFLLRATEPPENDARALRGHVHRADGSAASSAWVTCDGRWTRTRSDGSFALGDERGDARDHESERELWAFELGHEPARIALPPLASAERGRAALALELGPPTTRIAGRVVDRTGAPVANARVWLLDGTRLGQLGAFPIELEAALAGAPLPEEALASLADEARIAPEAFFDSATPARAPSAALRWATSADDGSFSLDGLLTRRYTLAAVDAELEGGTRRFGVAAGDTRVELLLDAPPRLYEAQLVDAVGTPLAAVEIEGFLSPLDVELAFGAGRARVQRFFLGRRLRSDAEGRFRWNTALGELAGLHVYGPTVNPRVHPLATLRDGPDSTLELATRAYLEVALDRDHPAERVRVLDASGAPLELARLEADGYARRAEVTLAEGRSGVLALDVRARLLELRRGDAVTESLALAPRAGEVLRIVR